jgi:hypothetical protein
MSVDEKYPVFRKLVWRHQFALILSGWIEHDVLKRTERSLGLVGRFLRWARNPVDELLVAFDDLETGLHRSLTTVHYAKIALREGNRLRLKQVLTDVAHGRPSRQHIEMKLTEDGDLELSPFDAVRLRIALDNLIDNAARAAALVATRKDEIVDTIDVRYDIDHERKRILLTVSNRGKIDHRWIEGRIDEILGSDEGDLQSTRRDSRDVSGLSVILRCLYASGEAPDEAQPADDRRLEYETDEQTHRVTARILFCYD